ncbi:OB-fold nucleic acid binding domain-containing protein [Arthrobacter castelli]|uniref:OB-fold nucleic acid binding domain-containing protein n=1 Tax=Arthrobacter castelli TaxID=271431 RepID=UPI000686D4E6|nr:OB-fold nucleic acid binding domain-containing protein [Arthrobacter castelli]
MAEHSRAVFLGVIDSITVPPASAPPSFSAIVVRQPDTGGSVQTKAPLRSGADTGHTGPRRSSGAGRLRLIWIGQRQIPGIAAGTTLKLEGMVSAADGMPTIYNPRYEIISSQESR